MVHLAVILEEFQACFSVDAGQVIGKLVSSGAEVVHFFIAEADHGIICDGASIIDLIDAGPKACVKAHGAGFSGGIEFATGQIMILQLPGGISYGSDLAVAGGILSVKDLVVTLSDNFPIFYNDRAKGATMSIGDSLVGLLDRCFHILILC